MFKRIYDFFKKINKIWLFTGMILGIAIAVIFINNQSAIEIKVESELKRMGTKARNLWERKVRKLSLAEYKNSKPKKLWPSLEKLNSSSNSPEIKEGSLQELLTYSVKKKHIRLAARGTIQGTQIDIKETFYPPSDPRIITRFSKNEAEAAGQYLLLKRIKEDIIPSGKVEYGGQVDVSFDEVQSAIEKISPYDPTYGSKGINLTNDEKKIYTEIGLEISCEFCCEVDSLVNGAGKAACRCAHSQMMRGLTAHLIQNTNMDRKRILKELKTWKTAFFPRQMLAAEIQNLGEAGEINAEKLLREFPDFMPQMVGDC